jgi:UPF0755 protein
MRLQPNCCCRPIWILNREDDGVALTRRGRLVVFLALLLMVLAIPAAVATVYLRSIGLWGESVPGKEVEVAVKKGASVDEIGQALEDAGVVKSAFGFRLATFLEEGAEKIQSGSYRLPQGLNARDALRELLNRGPAGQEYVAVTFPEGSRLTDFAAVLDRDTHISKGAFLRLVTSGRVRGRYVPDGVESLEGMLFPSTYQIVAKDDARSVAQRLVDEFDKRAAEVGIDEAGELGVTPYEAVIIASMIEAETFQDEERPKVSAVIYNRLNQGIALGIDATIQYALGDHDGELSSADLNINSPYNTRKVKGLPPTPIGSPGIESLQAALHPAAGDWLYYVLTDCDGHHTFSVDYDDFLSDKATYKSLDCG